VVQQELPSEDEGREGIGDSGQPVADETASGVLRPLEPPSARPLAFRDTEPAPSEFDAPGLALEPAVAFEPADQHRATGHELSFTRIADEIWAWLKTLTSAAVYATLIVTFGFQVARVEGESMAPTLEDQDRLIVNKLHYRLDAPVVGDIVMLYYPVDPDKSFVKRVIGEPGDTIRMEDGHVYRNDVPLKDDFVADEYKSHDSWGPEVVPQGYYFVLGDHRNNSSDSRLWGFVPKKYIIGKVQLRWWPLKDARLF
jgi:signal peptidase I